MTKSKSLVFFGTEDFSLSALKVLVEHEYNVLCVVTKPDTKRGRGRKLSPPSVKVFAEENSIPVLQNTSMNAVAKELANYPAEVAVLSAFGRIIPEEILKMYPLGIVNIHPSLLPRWRGASPIEQTILSGDNQAGVSLMKLVKEMDTGPIFAQESIELNDTETSTDLYEKLSAIGSQLLVKKLPQIINVELIPEEQDETKATYAPMISKQNAVIDWSESADLINRKIRAYVRWPGVKHEIAGQDCKLIESTVVKDNIKPGEVSRSGDGILIGCGKGSLRVTKLQPAGKRVMNAKEFILGNELMIGTNNQ